jgi:hypothetical protein
MNTFLLKEWIVKVVSNLEDHDLIREGMELYAQIDSSGTGRNIDSTHVEIRLGNAYVALPKARWYEINGLMIAGQKIQAIKKLRTFIQDKYHFLPGIKDTKEAVEDRNNFPA